MIKGLFTICKISRKSRFIIFLLLSLFILSGFYMINVTISDMSNEIVSQGLLMEKEIVSLNDMIISDNADSDIEYKIKGFLPKIYADTFMDYHGDTIIKIVHTVPLQDITKYYMKLNIDTENLVFIGNSLVEGLRLYSNSDNKFVCKVGINLDGLKSGYYDKLRNYSCDTVVIGMGTNELGSYSKEKFMSSYMDLVEHIRSINSDVNIICLSIPPVSQSKSSNSSSFNNYNVEKYNEYIKELCQNNELYFINNEIFFGSVLNSKWTGDGIHLKGNIYRDWYDFIISEIEKL